MLRIVPECPATAAAEKPGRSVVAISTALSPPSSGPSASAAGQPSRPEDERDVVALDPGQAGERVGRLLGLFLGCHGRGHGVSLMGFPGRWFGPGS